MQEYAEAHADEMEAAPAPANPLLLGMSPPEYVLNALSNLRSADLEQALLLLPFNYALDLLGYLCYWLERSIRVHPAHCNGMCAAVQHEVPNAHRLGKVSAAPLFALLHDDMILLMRQS